MELKFLIPLILVLFVPTLVSAQNISFAIDGECHEFNISLSSSGLEEGCYDIKIEALSPSGGSMIFNPREGWKSSFFYIEKGYCGGIEHYKVKTTSNDDLEFRVKLRKNSTILSSDYYKLKQNCPKNYQDPEQFFLVVLSSILLILVGITAYVKWFK